MGRQHQRLLAEVGRVGIVVAGAVRYRELTAQRELVAVRAQRPAAERLELDIDDQEHLAGVRLPGRVRTRALVEVVVAGDHAGALHRYHERVGGVRRADREPRVLGRRGFRGRRRLPFRGNRRRLGGRGALLLPPAARRQPRRGGRRGARAPPETAAHRAPDCRAQRPAAARPGRRGAARRRRPAALSSPSPASTPGRSRFPPPPCCSTGRWSMTRRSSS